MNRVLYTYCSFFSGISTAALSRGSLVVNAVPASLLSQLHARFIHAMNLDAESL